MCNKLKSEGETCVMHVYSDKIIAIDPYLLSNGESKLEFVQF